MAYRGSYPGQQIFHVVVHDDNQTLHLTLRCKHSDEPQFVGRDVVFEIIELNKKKLVLEHKHLGVLRYDRARRSANEDVFLPQNEPSQQRSRTC